jgi:hypothetical protein
MASLLTRKLCAAGNSCKHAANFNCEGCSQAFCSKHVSDHRRFLGEELNEIIGEHDHLKNALIHQTTESELHPLIKKIDDWEKISIAKVRQRANETRQELIQLITVHTNEISERLQKVAEQLSQGQEHDDFIETDLRRWKETLAKLKLELASPSLISICQDEKILSISDISINQNAATLSVPELSLQQSETVPLKLKVLQDPIVTASLFEAFRQYKCIVNDILERIEKRQYRSFSDNMVTSLDELVKRISRTLLQLGVAPTTSCFYSLPLSVTQGDDGTAKTAKWISHHTNDHWVISSTDSLWCAWHQNAQYFQVIMEHTCAEDGFRKTLQELEALLISQK